MTYNMHPTPQDILVKKLYRVFYLQNEQYLITYKLLYIYNSLPTPETERLEALKRLRREYRRYSNDHIIDRLYARAEHEKLLAGGRYAPPLSRPPTQERQYIRGWKLA
jgi:hypothetical protein